MERKFFMKISKTISRTTGQNIGLFVLIFDAFSMLIPNRPTVQILEHVLTILILFLISEKVNNKVC